MIIGEVQIHGYRKGHQLIASSVSLTKDDQAVVDRLSDIAGPLRPREQFAPYLSAYPLPSGAYYVVARTWQDLTVSRAGCVLTKSVLINAQTWALNFPLSSVLKALNLASLPTEMDAVSVELQEQQAEEVIPAVTDFSANELLEALFLEDAKPVVVFDAPHPELIAARLLTALWPDIRGRFSLSTFALSPRRIGGRDLDLVFAPMSAKAKFSDWPGRRVDGRASADPRHRWTETIVNRVFVEPTPKLLSSGETRLLAGRDSGSSAALRVALLWDELFEKLPRAPTAALGLLDIANSGMVSKDAAMKAIEPRLAEATREVAKSLGPSDAWDFVGAITQKIQGQDMARGWAAIQELSTYLASQAPSGAINLLRESGFKGAIDNLIPSIALGLGKSEKSCVEQELIDAPADIIIRLVLQGGTLASRIAGDDRLIGKLGIVLAEVERDLAKQAGMILLPFLVEDRQLTAAAPIFGQLDAHEIAAELYRLGRANDFKAARLTEELINRARNVGGLLEARAALVSSSASARRDKLLGRTLEPVGADVMWLLDDKNLFETTSVALLLDVLRGADDNQLSALLSDQIVGKLIVERLPEEAVNILVKALTREGYSMDAFIRAMHFVMPKIDNDLKLDIAPHVLERCLRSRFDGATNVISMLLGVLGTRLNGGWAAKVGLGDGLDAEIATRNMIAFEKSPLGARKRLVEAIDEIAWVIRGRTDIDLAEEACDACAKLMFDAEKTSRKSLIEAAGLLMPSLLRARRQPVSLMVAALFPVIYEELAKADDVPSLLMFIPFFDWDRCKAARREVVNSFMSSSWRAGDLALTACRCGDLVKILKQVYRCYGGEKYLIQIEDDLDRFDREVQHLVRSVIAEILLSQSSKSN